MGLRIKARIRGHIVIRIHSILGMVSLIPLLIACALMSAGQDAMPTPVDGRSSTSDSYPPTAIISMTDLPRLENTTTGTNTAQAVGTPSLSHTPAMPATATVSASVTSTPDVLTEYEAAMRPAFTSDITLMAHVPRYHLALMIDPVQGLLTGTERILFHNRTDRPLQDIALRLYPNFPPDVFGEGGDVHMEVTGITVAGQSVEIRYEAQRTAILVPLPQTLEVDQSVTLFIEFRATLKPMIDGTWPLLSYYPMLAVYDSSGWRLDVTQFLDHVYAESALYSAEITIPSTLQMATTGTTIAIDMHDDMATYNIRSGPVREFALTIGNFVVEQDTGGIGNEVGVNVYKARDSGLDAQLIARVAAAALTDYDLRFGQYPYRELDIHLLPGDYDGGDEFPGLIMLYSDAQVDAGTRYVTAHEVAHQWWYSTVGNDIYHEPWLDEALAQYSAIIYAEDVEGKAVAESDWEREVLRRYNGAVADGDLPIGWPLDRYPHFNAYYRTVYGKGAVFLRHVRDQLGDDSFFRALNSYYQTHRYGVATTQGIRDAFEKTSGQDLEQLFRSWVTDL